MQSGIPQGKAFIIDRGRAALFDGNCLHLSAKHPTTLILVHNNKVRRHFFRIISCIDNFDMIRTENPVTFADFACRDPRDQNRRGNARGDLQGSVS